MDDLGTMEAGATESSKVVTVLFIDGEVKTDKEDSLTIFSRISGDGQFEVKSNVGWENMTVETTL